MATIPTTLIQRDENSLRDHRLAVCAVAYTMQRYGCLRTPTGADSDKASQATSRRNITKHVAHRTEQLGIFASTLTASQNSRSRTQMKRNYPGYSHFLPLVLWSDLATKTLEMMLASAQVIGYRTGRLALAGAAPNARDWREFALMGQEKFEAGAQSAQAMAAHMMTTGQPWGALAFPDLLRTSAAFMSLASSRTPSQLIARQAALARALGQSAVRMTDVAKDATKLANRGLKPIHAKVTANAKRLAKR